MLINTNSMVSMTEANQNFSKVAKIVDETGSAIILKNNSPKYVVLEFAQFEKENQVSNDELLAISKKIINANKEAYEVLAK